MYPKGLRLLTQSLEYLKLLLWMRYCSNRWFDCQLKTLAQTQIFFFFLPEFSESLLYRKHQEETTTDFIFLGPSHRKWCTPLLPWFLVSCIADPVFISQETQEKISGSQERLFVVLFCFYLLARFRSLTNSADCWCLISLLLVSLSKALTSSWTLAFSFFSLYQRDSSISRQRWWREGDAYQSVWPAQNCPSRTTQTSPQGIRSMDIRKLRHLFEDTKIGHTSNLGSFGCFKRDGPTVRVRA